MGDQAIAAANALLSVKEVCNLPQLHADELYHLAISCGDFHQNIAGLLVEKLEIPVAYLNTTLRIRVQPRSKSAWADVFNKAIKGVTKTFPRGFHRSTNESTNGRADTARDLELEIPILEILKRRSKGLKGFFPLTPVGGRRNNKAPTLEGSYTSSDYNNDDSLDPQIALAVIMRSLDDTFDRGRSSRIESQNHRTSNEARSSKGLSQSDKTTMEKKSSPEDNDWIPATCPTTGKTYYYNKFTRETQWTDPTAHTAQKLATSFKNFSRNLTMATLSSNRTASDTPLSTEYVPLQNDPIDLRIGYFLKQNPDIAAQYRFKRLRLGDYMLNSRRVKVHLKPWPPDYLEPILVIQDGPLKQPFVEYMNGSSQGEVYEEVEPACAVQHVPHNSRLTFKIPKEHRPPDRLAAMQVATKEADMREEAALHVLAADDPLVNDDTPEAAKPSKVSVPAEPSLRTAPTIPIQNLVQQGNQGRHTPAPTQTGRSDVRHRSQAVVKQKPQRNETASAHISHANRPQPFVGTEKGVNPSGRHSYVPLYGAETSLTQASLMGTGLHEAPTQPLACRGSTSSSRHGFSYDAQQLQSSHSYTYAIPLNNSTSASYPMAASWVYPSNHVGAATYSTTTAKPYPVLQHYTPYVSSNTTAKTVHGMTNSSGHRLSFVSSQPDGTVVAVPQTSIPLAGIYLSQYSDNPH
eukprot:Filipodium_phascolosomae@DN4507_c0_g1_i1.p1